MGQLGSSNGYVTVNLGWLLRLALRSDALKARSDEKFIMSPGSEFHASAVRFDEKEYLMMTYIGCL